MPLFFSSCVWIFSLAAVGFWILALYYVYFIFVRALSKGAGPNI